MFNDFRQSTMKSDPVRPTVSFGTSATTRCVSPVSWGTVGTLGLAASAADPCLGAKLMAGAAAATPARNWRRLIFGGLDKAGRAPGSVVGRQYDMREPALALDLA